MIKIIPSDVRDAFADKTITEMLADEDAKILECLMIRVKPLGNSPANLGGDAFDTSWVDYLKEKP